MPTILRIEGFRFFFYSNENNEPAHVHINKAGGLAKFWLQPVELAMSKNFNAVELGKLEKLVSKYKENILEAWNEFFSN
jgi:hypothetical protein